METTTLNTPELDEEKSRLDLWKESVGKFFKLTTKSYGIRTVVYTQVKAVKETGTDGDFEVSVLCAEITARVLSGKRSHSSVCKEGTIHHNHESVLMPSGFGEECQLREFEKVTSAILTHTTTILDLVMQPDPEEKTSFEVPIDFPHLKLTDMEASLVRTSPFLIKDVYLLSPNSRLAAFEAINADLRQAAKNTRLTDAGDSVYVAQKSEAVASLRNKLNAALMESNAGQRTMTTPAFAIPSASANPITAPVAPAAPAAPVARVATATPVPAPQAVERPVSTPPAKPALQGLIVPSLKKIVSSGPKARLSPEHEASINLALRGKPSDAILSWQRQNPSSEGVVYRIGKDCGLLRFGGWANISGRSLSEQESIAGGKKVRNYFSGADSVYTGPDREGVYPLFEL